MKKFKVVEDTPNTRAIQMEQFRKTIKITRWKSIRQIEIEITEHGDKRNRFSGFGLKNEELDDVIEFLKEAFSLNFFYL